VSGKTKLYIGLLMAGLALLSVGLWLLFYRSPVIEIPEGEPVITMNLTNPLQGTSSLLSIYGDGTVISRQDDWFNIGLGNEDYPATSVWKTGMLAPEKLGELTAMCMDSAFLALEESYQSESAVGSGTTGKINFIVSFSHESIKKTVRALGYLNPLDSTPASRPPYPLDIIAEKLTDIYENMTEEIYRETY